ncbi:uncharacterized protein LOC144095264 [Amblyomma americanum]
MVIMASLCFVFVSISVVGAVLIFLNLPDRAGDSSTEGVSHEDIVSAIPPAAVVIRMREPPASTESPKTIPPLSKATLEISSVPAPSGGGPSSAKSASASTSMRVTTPTAVTTTRPAQTTTTGPLPPAQVFCSLGENFDDERAIATGYCDYVVYPDLTVAGADDITSMYGSHSWDAFQEAFSKRQPTMAGVSLTSLHATHPGSVVARLPALIPQLRQLVNALDLRAVGVLDFPRHGGRNTASLGPAYQIMDEVLRGKQNKSIFLGVLLTSSQQAQLFASELSGLGMITTIILETHVSRPLTLGGKCVSQLISLNSPSNVTSLPNLATAEFALAQLRSLRKPLRLLFSSTLGAMMYVGGSGAGPITGANQSCEQALMVDIDYACNYTGPQQHWGYDAEHMAPYHYYTSNNYARFYTYENQTSLDAKGGLEINFEYFCTRRGIASTVVTVLSITLFLVLNIASDVTGVYLWLRYLSFTYSLMGVFQSAHSFLSSVDSSTTVFSVLYYGVGSVFFLAGGIGVLTKGYAGVASLVIGSFAVVLGVIMCIFTICGSKM